MLRVSANCSVMTLLPMVLPELMEVSPGMLLKRRSSGAATEAAMTLALAPGRLANTAMVG